MSSSREYWEIEQNLSFTKVIFPCGSVPATMACSSRAAFRSVTSRTAASSPVSARFIAEMSTMAFIAPSKRPNSS